MKRGIGILFGVWVISNLVLLAYLTNRPLYQLLVDGGAQLYSCIDWDANDRVISGVCSSAPPLFVP